VQAPWQGAGAAAADTQTLADWARRRVRTRLGRFAIEAFSQGVLACEPGEVSLLHVLFYLRSAGGFRQLTETSGAAQQDRFDGGAQLIAIRLAGQLGPGTVRLGAPVARIEQTASRAPCTRRAWWRPGAGPWSPCRPRWPGGSATSRRCRLTAISSPRPRRWAR
jgi:monoamine oxidase